MLLANDELASETVSPISVTWIKISHFTANALYHRLINERLKSSAEEMKTSATDMELSCIRWS